MRLFTIGPDYQAELNKEWISMIPEFNALLKRDKGSPGDYRGEKKLKAKKELTFIYLDLDFTSPLREHDEFTRREQAMKDAGLTESDLDAVVIAAHKRYSELLNESSHSLKMLKAVKKGLDKLVVYFENIDFTEKDKKGELVNTPKDYLINLKTLKPAYDAVDEFEDRVKTELEGDGGIRGKATLGGKEGKRDKDWNETPAEQQEEQTESAPQARFGDIARVLRDANKLTAEEDE